MKQVTAQLLVEAFSGKKLKPDNTLLKPLQVPAYAMTMAERHRQKNRRMNVLIVKKSVAHRA